MRWGKAIGNTVGWDWLVDSIDLRRVYATLDNFPVNDQYELKPDQGVERFCTGPSEENEISPYSPGFVLPLVLQALEDDNEYRRWMAKSESRRTVPLKCTLSGFVLTQRLCEKGALALALVSLCSHDASIRKLSTSILWALLKSIGSNDAHQNPFWRDRSQLAMMINAVQRSLVVKHASDNAVKRQSSTIIVPKLPGFATVFLARASLVLSRPNDPMFVAINRAFLHTESDFGAFQDLTRIPVFVSLYCSSSTDPEQLKVERKFSLDLVRAGLTEGDYKLLMACHCPDLLLTSFEWTSARSSHQQDDESCLILKTLSKLVGFGGDQGASHLLDRMGLLSWLRSIMCDGNRTTLNLSRSAWTEMLILLVQVIRRSSSLLPASELMAATSGMAQAVLSMANDVSTCSPTSDGMIAYRTNSLFIQEACEVLLLLKVAFLGSEDDLTQECNQSDGYEVESACQFLSEIVTAKEIESALCSLCTLPMSQKTVNSSHVQAFCMKILTLVSSDTVPEVHSPTMVAVLRRVGVLSSRMNNTENIQNFIDLIMSLWCSCANAESREAWYHCIDMITSQRGGNSSPFELSPDGDGLASFLLRLGENA